MPYSILVGTPNAAFGELIRISLEENPDYRVRLVHHSNQVLATIERIPVDLAILDADLPGHPFFDLAWGLLQRFNHIKLMVIPPDNNPAHPALHGLIPHAYLNKPFYLPELLGIVERLLKFRDQSSSIKDSDFQKQEKISRYPSKLTESASGVLWIDSAQVEQKLSELLPGSTILEGLILQNGRLWVYAGKLTEKAVHELESVFSRLLPAGAGALIRFIRLSTGHEYLLYAGAILGDLHLVLVFPGNYPLSRMRIQAASFRDSLRSMFSSEQHTLSTPLTKWDKEVSEITGEVDESAQVATQNAFGDQVDVEGQEEIAPIDLNEILGEIPAPDPGLAEPQRTLSSEWNFEDNRAASGEISELEFSISDTARTRIKQASSSWDQSVIEELSLNNEKAALSSLEDTQPVFHRKHSAKTENNPPLTEAGYDTGIDNPPETPPFILPGKSESGDLPEKKDKSSHAKGEPDSVNHPFDWMDNEDDWAEVAGIDQKPPGKKPGKVIWQNDEISDTQPLVLPKLAQIKDLETAYPAYSSLTYTFLLVPAIPTVLLIGDLAAQLVRWVPQLCLAYGWRLDQVLVRPKYIQWTVRVLPYGSPGNIASTMRLQLSNQILRHHLDLEEMLPSGEFWAPGYLVVAGPQIASSRLIEEFIADIRQRQGLFEGGNPSDTIRS